jgi:hypothetical protein
MARVKSLLAILLALALLVSPATIVLADGPGTYEANGGGTSDGHPWDDEVVESDPGTGDDPNTPGNSTPISGDVPAVNSPTAATSGSGAQWIEGMLRTVITRWLVISEMKAVKSTSAQRVR